MTVKVTFDFNSADEAAAFLLRYSSSAGVTPADFPAPAEQPAKRRGRPPTPKPTMAAETQTEPLTVAKEEDPFSIDEPKPEPVKAEPAKPVTKEDVRAALVAFQTAVKEKLLKTGKSEDDAKTEAMATARALLNKVGGTDKLGGLDEGKNAAVVTAAREATAKL